MRLNAGDGGGMKSEPNVVPLCDILLVLLIIFMIVTPAIINEPVDLPEAVSAKANGSEGQAIVLVVQSDGTIVLDGAVVHDYAAIADALNGAFESRQDRKVYLKADSSLPYGTIMSVLDEVQRAGVTDVGVVTDELLNQEERDLVLDQARF